MSILYNTIYPTKLPPPSISHPASLMIPITYTAESAHPPSLHATKVANKSLTSHTPPQQLQHHPHSPQPPRHHPQNRNRNKYTKKNIQPARRERRRGHDSARGIEEGVESGIQSREEHFVWFGLELSTGEFYYR